jgi:hypothetical protein
MSKKHRNLARLVVTLSTASALIAATAAGAGAFAPTKLKALGSNSHQSITESSIKTLDNEFFSIAKLTKPMTKAMDQIVDANSAVDDDQVRSALHFDGENFAGGQSRIIGLFNSVVTDLQAENAGQARTHLGGALHTIQDFYAHSNWVELGNGGANPDLGRPGRSLGPVAGPTEATCNGSVLTTTKLTSGYYGGEDRTAPIATKCRHGGPFDGSPGSGGINKDLANSLISPHSTFHGAAAGAASAATLQFIRDIKAKVTARQLKLLFGVGPTLGMSIDTTGSMGSVISSVREQAIQIVNDRAGTKEEPSKYVLAPFNDPSTGPLTTTTDPDEYKSAISALSADGGDDCPELSMTGMQQAVAAMDEGSDLFTFTDASAKDAGLADSVASLAKSKDIRIYPILFGNCGGEGLAPRTGQQGMPQGLAAASFAPNPEYQQVAQATGGQVFALSTRDAGAITALADALVRSAAVNVLNVTAALTDTEQAIAVPVDSGLTRVTFSASGAATSSQTAVVTRPDGTAVQPGDAGVQFVELSPSSSPATIVTVTAPAAGRWTVTLSGDGTTSLRVTGESDLDLSSFRFLAGDGVSTEPGTGGVRAIDGFPVGGQQAGADAVLTDGFTTAQFDLRAPDGSPIQALSLPRLVDNEFAAMITVPTAPFLVYVTGTDVAGMPYQRVLPGIVAPQSVLVGAPPSRDLAPDRASTFEFSVRNLGAEGTFFVTATDDQGYLQSFTPTEILLAAGGTGSVSVVVQPPADAPDGTTDTLTVSVVSADRPDLRNFAVLANAVTAAGATDTTAPTVTATLTPAPNPAGWNNHDVTVALAATDEDGGSGVASVSYSATGAQAIPPTTVPGAAATVAVTHDGVTTVTYTATDVAGNTSAPRTVTVRLDKTPPALTCQATPSRIWPPTLLLVPVHVAVGVSDAGSGAAGFTLRSVTATHSHAGDIVGWTPGTADTQGSLRAVTDLVFDRVYTLTYDASDTAGNLASCQATVRVSLLPFPLWQHAL